MSKSDLHHLEYDELPKGSFYIGTNENEQPFILPDYWLTYYDESEKTLKQYTLKENSISCNYQDDFDDYISSIGMYNMYQTVVINRDSDIIRYRNRSFIINKYTLSEKRPLDQCPHITNPQTLFLYYIRSNNFLKMKELFHNPQVCVSFAMEIDGDNPITQACYVNNIDMVKLFLDNNIQYHPDLIEDCLGGKTKETCSSETLAIIELLESRPDLLDTDLICTSDSE